MEYFNGNGFMEELLSLRRDSWETNFNGEIDDFLLDDWNFDCFYPNPDFILPNNYSLQGAAAASNNDQEHDHGFAHVHFDTLVQEENPLMVVENKTSCKVEPVQVTETPAPLDAGLYVEPRNRAKKIDGKPSKNLMAERRRRKRLNDRLSMLRSIVPKISKMDRTSILGDTIDYMKELLDRIKNFEEEEIAVSSVGLNLMGMFKELKPNEILVRNTPKFDVERRNTDTRIEVCCNAKPNLLLSTIATLEALDLEIQQCVISCFSDFTMQASCSEDMERKLSVSSEEIKEALFRNAGYGGRCL